MRHAKFFSITVFAAVLGYGAVAFYFLPLATFQGELTRMGLLPESIFGWTKQQPVIDAKWMQQTSLKEADVLVIGDSFSDSRVWQTVLTQHGMKVRTESWDSLRGVCDDFTPWVRSQGFAGQFVVLESIERNVENDLKRSVACPQMQYHPNPNTDALRYPPALSFDVNSGNYSGKLSTGIKTKLNVWKYERLSKSADFKSWQMPNDVKMARISKGCTLFSHARCDDTLFYAVDRVEDVDNSALQNFDRLNSSMEGITPIWAVVPNKSTAYLYPNKQFWIQAKRRYHSPDLLNMTQRAIENGTVDLYPANGTHFSTSGYLMMGEEIYKTMRLARPGLLPR